MTHTPQHWTHEDDTLVQTFECDNFKEAIDLINRIAVLAEDVGHHPELCLHDYKHVTVILTTHDAGAVTDKDRDLAERIDDLVG